MSGTAVVRGSLGLLFALALGGCSLVGDVRRVPQTPEPSAVQAVTSAAPTPTIAFQVRTARVPVPPGYARSTVEFADAEHGAALFTRCAQNECAAVILVTADGGASWQTRRHPQPVAVNHQLYLGRDRTIVLLSEPSSWYVSRDDGRTFAPPPDKEQPPVAYRTLDGPYEICCEGALRDEAAALDRRQGGRGADAAARARQAFGGRLPAGAGSVDRLDQ